MPGKKEYLKFLQDKLNTDEEKSEQILTAVFQTLHERLTEGLAEHIETHLPVDVKPLWWGQLRKTLSLWRRQPEKYNYPEFLEKVKERANLEGPEEAKKATEAVFQLLKLKIPERESANVATQLPQDLEQFWQAA